MINETTVEKTTIFVARRSSFPYLTARTTLVLAAGIAERITQTAVISESIRNNRHPAEDDDRDQEQADKCIIVNFF